MCALARLAVCQRFEGLLLLGNPSGNQINKRNGGFQVLLNLIGLYFPQFTVIAFKAVIKNAGIELAQFPRYVLRFDKVFVKQTDDAAVFTTGKILCQQKGNYCIETRIVYSVGSTIEMPVVIHQLSFFECFPGSIEPVADKFCLPICHDSLMPSFWIS